MGQTPSIPQIQLGLRRYLLHIKQNIQFRGLGIHTILPGTLKVHMKYTTCIVLSHFGGHKKIKICVRVSGICHMSEVTVPQIPVYLGSKVLTTALLSLYTINTSEANRVSLYVHLIST